VIRNISLNQIFVGIVWGLHNKNIALFGNKGWIKSEVCERVTIGEGSNLLQSDARQVENIINKVIQ